MRSGTKYGKALPYRVIDRCKIAGKRVEIIGKILDKSGLITNNTSTKFSAFECGFK